MSIKKEEAWKKADELDNFTWGIFDKYLNDNYDFYYTNPLYLNYYSQSFTFYINGNMSYRSRALAFLAEVIKKIENMENCSVYHKFDGNELKVEITQFF